VAVDGERGPAVKTSDALLTTGSSGSGGGARSVESGLQRRRSERNVQLDIVKGLLVLLMILYHWLNYFVTNDGAVYRYLRFVTPSFIFISGFVITNVYLAKYRIGERQLHWKLLVRGLKLLALFTGLNLGASLLVPTNYDGTTLGVGKFLGSAFAVYVIGDGRGAAFEVLVPIGYLLAVSSALLWGYRVHRHFLLGSWLAGVVGVYVLKWKGTGSGNVELITMGLLGMMAGCLTREVIDRIQRGAAAWIGVYAIYLVVLRVYDVRYEVQVVGLVLNVGLLYLAALRLGEGSAIARQVIALGKYSLLAYVAHIAILQALARAMRPWDLGASSYGLSLGAALMLTVLAIQATVWARTRSARLDALYRGVFA
jgi:uncharacterized membrane protein